MKKSSEKKFYEIINTLYDNSMGDMNYLPFSFIDEMNLQNDFEDYLIKELGWRAATQGYFDGESRLPHDKRWKKIPELFKHYHKAYLAGRRNR
jgi:hypothetical protein